MKQKHNDQTAHRIEDTRSQVQYTMHQSLRTLIKTDKYHKKKNCSQNRGHQKSSTIYDASVHRDFNKTDI